MSVQSINFLNTGNNTNRAINSSKLRHEVVKYSGYGALGLGIASGIAAKNKKRCIGKADSDINSCRYFHKSY